MRFPPPLLNRENHRFWCRGYPAPPPQIFYWRKIYCDFRPPLKKIFVVVVLALLLIMICFFDRLTTQRTALTVGPTSDKKNHSCYFHCSPVHPIFTIASVLFFFVGFQPPPMWYFGSCFVVLPFCVVCLSVCEVTCRTAWRCEEAERASRVQHKVQLSCPVDLRTLYKQGHLAQCKDFAKQWPYF